MSRRLPWRAARLLERREETPTARTLVLDVPGWPGHLAGQHVDVRLTAPDGYTAQRSYSLAAPPDGGRIELSVQRIDDGEVSAYLTDVFDVGDVVELRGPVGGWFVWRPTDPEPVTLVAGGSGIVPLMAMVRARAAAGSRAPFRLVHSVRAPDERYYVAELKNDRDRDGVAVRYVYTRSVPEGWPRPPGRVGIADLEAGTWPPSARPTCFVCGPTGFVEAVADLLTDIGHDSRRIRTERFGSASAPGSGG